MHLHEWPSYSSLTSSGFNSRLYHQSLVLQEIVQSALVNNVRDIIFCGDLFHQRGKITPGVNFVLHEFFSNCAKSHVNIHIVLGNHDMQTALLNGLHLLKGWSKVYVYDKPTRNHVHCWNFIPYTTNKEQLRVNLFNDGNGGESIHFIHQGIGGVPMGSGYVVDEIMTPLMVPPGAIHCFAGHYHTHTKINDALTVVGNPIPQNWNDVNLTKGWLIYDEHRSYSKIDSITAPLFLHSTYDELKECCQNNFLKVKGCDPKLWQDIKLEFLQKGALSVEFEPPESSSTLLLPNASSLNIPNMIDNILEKRKLISPEIRKIGEQLREGTFNV